jgi:hypothetical protein
VIRSHLCDLPDLGRERGLPLAELRDVEKLLLKKLNNRPMQKLKKSRRQLFEGLER